MPDLDLNSLLQKCLGELGFDIDEAKQLKLLAYLELMFKWNKAYNLTAVRDKKAMLTRHIAESLALIPYIYGQNIADIGTGAGLPGIPLAIVFPDRKFTLIDSNGKKTRFLNQVKIELGLKNVSVVNSRIENLQSPAAFDQIFTRAFADIATTLKLLDDVWFPGCCLSLMKGPGATEEISATNQSLDFKLVELDIPWQQEFRCLVEIRH